MDVVLYNTADGTVQLEVQLDREAVWLNQRQMAELFDKDTDTIGLHIRNIYKEGELFRKGTTEESSVVQNEGGRQEQTHRSRFVYHFSGREQGTLPGRRVQADCRQRPRRADTAHCREPTAG